MLENADCRVILAADGGAALQLLDSQTEDLMVLDLLMPLQRPPDHTNVGRVGSSQQRMVRTPSASFYTLKTLILL